MTQTAYLDWNGAAPLCAEAKAAMIAAMDVTGNPSSIHAGGRKAKALIDEARDNIAELADCEPDEITFTSGATEAANWVLREGSWTSLFLPSIEHEAVTKAADRCTKANKFAASIASDGKIDLKSLRSFLSAKADGNPLLCAQAANSETGIVQDIAALARIGKDVDLRILTDAAQYCGRFDDQGDTFSFARSGAHYAMIASEKFGGPAGVGALITKSGYALPPLILGGGQEMRRRSGTENLLGIVGMGAAAKAVRETHNTQMITHLIDHIRLMVAAICNDFIEVGKNTARLANTFCVAVPGWKASTQLMQLDLKGIRVSAGSACSSGKVAESKVLRAMGFDSRMASSAIRVSIGRTTTEEEVAHFIDVWGGLYRDRQAKARLELDIQI